MSKKARKRKRRHEPEDYLTDPASMEVRALPEEEGSLGRRIAWIRRKRGLSLEDLASRTGIDVDQLKRIEQDDYTPPLGELIRLGKALQMKMGYFIAPAEPRPYTIVRSHERQTVARFASGSKARHGYTYESLAPEKGDRLMEPFIVTMHPGDVQEISTHDGQEFIYVLEGRLEARVGEKVEILDPGDAIYYNSTEPHLVKCHGDQVTRILAVLFTESR
jgi:quercetin dioxygenase-like cupin family protein/DNA-binding XRE family transcriptional regulator